MFILSYCATCKQRFEIIIETGDLDKLRPHMTSGWDVPCPKKCGGFIPLTGSLWSPPSVMRLSSKELLKKLEEK